MPRTRRRFTTEFKTEAVRLLEESGRPLQAIAEELGVHANQLRMWRNEHLAAGSAEALARQKVEAAELVRLRREVKRLEQENEILKRAAAFFAREAGASLGTRSSPRKTRANPRRRFPRTTNSDHGRPVAPNLLEQKFAAEQPDTVWLADISYIPTGEGWLYLAAIKDMATREIVGWSMADHLRGELARDALLMAIRRRQPPRGLLHHSDSQSA